jgi:hypothetical protein
MCNTPSGPQLSSGLPSNHSIAGSGGTLTNGGQTSGAEELRPELGSLEPVGGNPTVTQETELPTQAHSLSYPYPASQAGSPPLPPHTGITMAQQPLRRRIPQPRNSHFRPSIIQYEEAHQVFNNLRRKQILTPQQVSSLRKKT